MRISIVGGGRWARTIGSVLCSLPSRSDRVVIHTMHNAAGIDAWVDRKRLGDRVRVTTEWPSFSLRQSQPDAVIVANRVGNHFAAALPALRAGVPVLVEKPMAVPQSRIGELCQAADANSTLLAASNVFLFARYFESFAELIKTLGRPCRIIFKWTDGPADMRRGEAKSYDARVTLFDDILPHIVPMLGILKFCNLSLGDIVILRGGAELIIEAHSEGNSALLKLARNAGGRQRLIEIETETETATLDFSNEPGFIHHLGTSRDGDPRWDSAPRPLATMLTAFLAAVEGSPLDCRLSPAAAIATGGFADAVRRRYLADQAKWLEARLSQPLDLSLQYALKEQANDESDEAIAATWSAMGTISNLKLFLSQSHLFSAASQSE